MSTFLTPGTSQVQLADRVVDNSACAMREVDITCKGRETAFRLHYLQLHPVRSKHGQTTHALIRKFELVAYYALISMMTSVSHFPCNQTMFLLHHAMVVLPSSHFQYQCCQEDNAIYRNSTATPRTCWKVASVSSRFVCIGPATVHLLPYNLFLLERICLNSQGLRSARFPEDLWIRIDRTPIVASICGGTISTFFCNNVIVDGEPHFPLLMPELEGKMGSSFVVHHGRVPGTALPGRLLGFGMILSASNVDKAGTTFEPCDLGDLLRNELLEVCVDSVHWAMPLDFPLLSQSNWSRLVRCRSTLTRSCGFTVRLSSDLSPTHFVGLTCLDVCSLAVVGGFKILY